MPSRQKTILLPKLYNFCFNKNPIRVELGDLRIFLIFFVQNFSKSVSGPRKFFLFRGWLWLGPGKLTWPKKLDLVSWPDEFWPKKNVRSTWPDQNNFQQKIIFGLLDLTWPKNFTKISITFKNGLGWVTFLTDSSRPRRAEQLLSQTFFAKSHNKKVKGWVGFFSKIFLSPRADQNFFLTW